MDLQQALAGLTSCDISDACDDLGVPAARTGGIRPAWPDCPPIAGPLQTVTLGPGRGLGSPLPQLIEVLRATTQPLVLVDLGGRLDLQCWGQVLATVARSFGRTGALVNGATRDVAGLRDMGFPTYARGVVPLQIRDRVRFVRAGAEVDIEGVAVAPDWFAVADLSGTVFVPPDAVDAVLTRAREDAATERAALTKIQDGADPAAVLTPNHPAEPGSAP